jgi:hypothetical protein
MSNLNIKDNNSSLSVMSLDELLDYLGFNAWLTVTSTFILPSLSFIGIILCSLSAWIFSNKRKFKDPSFFYYRLLCLVYILHLCHNIPRGLFWTPQYFPQSDTYLTAAYRIYYAGVSCILYHFEDVIQMAILIDRMSVFSPWIKRRFGASPRRISFALFVTCLCIDAPYACSFKIKSFGTYYFYNTDDSKNSIRIETFYFPSPSDFSLTPFGRILLGFTAIFLNLILTVVIGVTLNVVSVHMYKSYLREKKQIENESHRVIFTTINSENNKSSRVEVFIPRQKRELTFQERNDRKERKVERNFFLMALTLCSLSILSRIIFIGAFVFYFIFNTFSNNIIVSTINLSIYTIVPSAGIFVFYSFNKIFRKEFNGKILRK